MSYQPISSSQPQTETEEPEDYPQPFQTHQVFCRKSWNTLTTLSLVSKTYPHLLSRTSLSPHKTNFLSSSLSPSSLLVHLRKKTFSDKEKTAELLKELGYDEEKKYREARDKVYRYFRKQTKKVDLVEENKQVIMKVVFHEWWRVAKWRAIKNMFRNLQ